MNEQWKDLLEKIKPRCESISENEEGILVKPKQMSFLQFIALHDQLIKEGADYLVESNSFLFPDPSYPHLKKLRVIFKTSQAEIRESILFLIENGFTPEQITDRTGASHATIYRYLGKR